MFDHNPQQQQQLPLQTPARPAQSDLLISFDTPMPQQTVQPPTIRKNLLDTDETSFRSSTSSRSSTSRRDQDLQDLLSATLDAERTKWQQEAQMRHAAELESLAADLHSQYREKHTRKVEALKLTYKKQYEKRISGLEERVGELEGETERLRGEVEVERKEKTELIVMSEELMRLTSAQGGE
jgi:Fungal Transforming acidic coiled-coil (TACC) proteins